MDKKYIKNVLVYILSGILAIVCIGYIAYHMSGSGTTNVDTETAVIIDMDNTVTTDALIMRDEVAIEGSGDDICGILRDGENAMAGEQVLWIFSGSGDIGAQIRLIEEQIRVLEDSLMGENIPSGLNTNNKDLKELYIGMLDRLGQGSLADMEKTAIGLQTYINRKKNSSSTEAAIKASIHELEQRRQTLLINGSAGVTTIVTPESGLFYSYTDGFESMCTTAYAEEMDLGEFSALKEQILSGQKANEGICKVVTDAYWYICLALDNGIARNMTEGEIYNISFPENEGITLPMTLTRMASEYGEKESLLVFGCRIVPDGFDFKRIQQVSIVTETYNGFRVPAGAVRYVDGKIGVYVSDGNKVRFRRIDILFAKDGNYVVKQYDITKEGYTDMLRLYDKIILSGKELYDGKYLN